jgi:hypothetical protein
MACGDFVAMHDGAGYVKVPIGPFIRERFFAGKSLFFLIFIGDRVCAALPSAPEETFRQGLKMERRTSIKHKTADMVTRSLKGAAKYCVTMAPFISLIADYYEAAGKEGVSREARDVLRLKAYRAALPELKIAFGEMIRDWEARLSGEPGERDLSFGSPHAQDVTALIFFLRSI